MKTNNFLYKKLDESESEQKTIPEAINHKEFEAHISHIIQSNFNASQLITVILSISVMIAFNFIRFLSDSISIFALSGSFQMDALLLLSYLINFAILVGSVALIMYLPKMEKERSKSLLTCILGGLIGLILFAMTRLFEPNEIHPSYSSFHLFDLIIFLPYLLYALFELGNEKDLRFLFNFHILSGTLILMLILCNFGSYRFFIEDFLTQKWLFSTILIFETALIIYLRIGILKSRSLQ